MSTKPSRLSCVLPGNYREITGILPDYLQSGPGKITALVYLPYLTGPYRATKIRENKNTTTTHNNQHEPLPPYPPAASALSLHG